MYDRLAAVTDGGGYDDPLPDLRSAIFDQLKNRRSTIYLPGDSMDTVVDLLTPRTRSALESHPRVAAILNARNIRTLKNGDMSGGDYSLTNAISRAVYEAEREGTEEPETLTFSGVRCPSAEAEISDTMNYSLFETGRDTNELRATLVPHLTLFALDEVAVLKAALKYFGIEDA
jgi:protein-disulfide isomerase-like protein with CxxC motif